MRKMLFFFEFLPEKNDSYKKKINSAALQKDDAFIVSQAFPFPGSSGYRQK